MSVTRVATSTADKAGKSVVEIRGFPQPTPDDNRAYRILRSPLGNLIPVVAVVALWEIGGRAGYINRDFFPVPSRIADALTGLIEEGVIGHHLAVTLERFIKGFALGAIPGIVFGILMGRFRWVRAILDPLVSATYPIPHLATLPLLLVIFGLGSAPIIVMSGIVCFYPIVISTIAGVRQVDEGLVRMARDLGAGRLAVIWKIVIPGALPAIFAGLRLALGLALLATVAGEFLVSGEGIGAQTWRYWQVYQVENMYSTLLVIVALGFTITMTTLFVERQFFGWASAANRDWRRR